MTPDQRREFDAWFDATFKRVAANVRHRRRAQAPSAPIPSAQLFLLTRDSTKQLVRIPLLGPVTMNYSQSRMRVADVEFAAEAIIQRLSTDPTGDDERVLSFDGPSIARAEIEVRTG